MAGINVASMSDFPLSPRYVRLHFCHFSSRIVPSSEDIITGITKDAINQKEGDQFLK